MCTARRGMGQIAHGPVHEMSDLLVICYHAVSSTWPADLAITPDALDRQLDFLTARGYHGLTTSDGIARPPIGRTVVITFDDAYRSVLEVAKPVLDRYGIPGTVYVPTDWPDRDAPMGWPGIDQWLGSEHRDELRCLRWDELRELHAAGWEIGSHTCSHPHLTQTDDADLHRELHESKQRVEAEIGQPCTSMAYPYGSVDARVAEAAGDAGYANATTIPRVRSLLRPLGPLQWPRIPIFRVDSDLRFKVKVSPTLRWLRAMPPIARPGRAG